MPDDFDFARLHFLIPQRGDPVLVPSDRSFTLGRAEGNNIVVDDSRASRRHAEILFDGTRFVITDLQSSNGTFVNGSAITTQPINDGDVVEIGLMSYTFRAVSNPDNLQRVRKESEKESHQQITQEMPALGTKGFAPDTDFSGTLATLHIADLCQLLSLSRRTGLLMIQANQGRALLYFDAGEIVQAEYGTHYGDAAVIAILHETQGHFSFKGDQRALEPNVHTKMQNLLLEAARQRDERES